MNNLVKHIINSKNFLYYFFGLCFFPLIMLSFFYQPASDDFWYAYNSQIASFWEVQIDRYNTWSGRYFSNGLLSLQNYMFEYKILFAIIPIFILIFFNWSLLFFIKSLRLFSHKNHDSFLTIVISIIFTAFMPSISEGVYWLPGSITNQLPVSLSLFYFGIVIRYFRYNHYAYLIPCFLLLFAIMGCNEAIVIEMMVIHVVLVIVNYNAYQKLNLGLVLLLLVTFFFAFIEISAPGNSLRANHFEVKHQFFYAIFNALKQVCIYSLKWIPLLLLPCLLFHDAIKHYCLLVSEKYFLNPIVAFFVFYSVFFGIFFAGFWSTNGLIPDRTINTLWFFFIMSFLYLFASSIVYFKNRITFEVNQSAQIVFLVLISFQFLYDNNITIAYKDLLSGKAFQYKKQVEARLYFLASTKQTQCKLEPITSFPATIYNAVDMGLTTDKNNWKNVEISEYFRKKSIIIKPIDSTITE